MKSVSPRRGRDSLSTVPAKCVGRDVHRMRTQGREPRRFSSDCESERAGGEEESGTHVPPDCAAARGPFCDPECEVRPPARLPGRLGKRGRPRAGCDQRVGGKGIGGPSGGEGEDDGPTDARTAHSL